MAKKRIAAITMARNDTFFLSRWIEYYGKLLGTENLYIFLDGIDQETPKNAGKSNIEKLPHTDMSRTAGDKYRINLISDKANELLQKYDLVIGCDCDEFLAVDPALNKNLYEYLSNKEINTSLSGLGLDIGQHLKFEKPLDF